MWLSRFSRYVQQNCELPAETRELTDEWQAHASRYLERLVQSPYYSDGAVLFSHEGDLMLRWVMMTGNLNESYLRSLRVLADFFVTNHHLSEYALSGHNGAQHCPSVGGQILNAAGYLMPGEGYQSYRRTQLGRRFPYEHWLFREPRGFGLPGSARSDASIYFNYELPSDNTASGTAGRRKLNQRMTGIVAAPLGEENHRYLRNYHDTYRRHGRSQPHWGRLDASNLLAQTAT